MEVPMSGWLGKRLALRKIKDSLKSSSDYFSRFRLKRTDAKLPMEVPMSGWFGKRFAFSFTIIIIIGRKIY
jgi:hypothetical protein